MWTTVTAVYSDWERERERKREKEDREQVNKQTEVDLEGWEKHRLLTESLKRTPLLNKLNGLSENANWFSLELHKKQMMLDEKCLFGMFITQNR